MADDHGFEIFTHSGRIKEEHAVHVLAQHKRKLIYPANEIGTFFLAQDENGSGQDPLACARRLSRISILADRASIRYREAIETLRTRQVVSN